MPEETSMNAQSGIREQFIGAWDLVSYEIRRPEGNTSHPLGLDPVGRISYDSAGRMSAQLMQSGVPKFAAARREQANADEVVAAWRGYIGYFGRYSIDEQAQSVTHHVEGAWYPNFVGTDQVRMYRLEGDILTLQADSPSGHTTIVWRRSR